MNSQSIRRMCRDETSRGYQARIRSILHACPPLLRAFVNQKSIGRRVKCCGGSNIAEKLPKEMKERCVCYMIHSLRKVIAQVIVRDSKIQNMAAEPYRGCLMQHLLVYVGVHRKVD